MEAAFLFEPASKESSDWRNALVVMEEWFSPRSARRRDPTSDPRSKAPYRCLRD